VGRETICGHKSARFGGDSGRDGWRCYGVSTAGTEMVDVAQVTEVSRTRFDRPNASPWGRAPLLFGSDPEPRRGLNPGLHLDRTEVPGGSSREEPEPNTLFPGSTQRWWEPHDRTPSR